MIEEVRSICRIEDALIRNLRITECYHHLSVSFAERVGPGANWCTFATWASRQAGCTIRGEDLIEHLSPHTPLLWRAVLRTGVLNPRTVPGWVVKHVHTPFDAVERASTAVAKGNLKVFEEIGEVFARWLADSSFVPAQPLLRDAFAKYGEAAQTSNLNQRARLMLFANIQCGFHEQTRLQPEIEAAMTAPLWLFRELLKDLVCEIVSQGFMTLKLPGDRRLRLGHDLDASLPECFEGIEREPLLARFERAGLGGVGAENWADLQQRMRYISRLFSCLHTEQALFQPPFSADQCATIRGGQLPRGVL